jgi:drug/metabolite transporter (DMT)-like permease
MAKNETVAAMTWLAFAAAAVCITIWGGTPVATKIAVAEMDPVLVGMLRTVVAVPLVLALLAVRRPPVPRGGRQWVSVMVVAFSSFIAFPVLFSMGQIRTSAAHGGLILAMLPVTTGIFAAVAERRLPTRLWVVGAAIAVAGEVALIGARGDLTGGEASLRGDLLVLLSALSAPVGYVTGARLARAMGTAAVTYWSIAVAGVLLLPVAGVMAVGLDWRGVSAEAWAGILYLAVGATVVCYLLWYWALNVGGVARVSTMQFFQPVVSVVLAVLILGEALTGPLVASAAVIVLGVALCQRPRKDPLD